LWGTAFKGVKVEANEVIIGPSFGLSSAQFALNILALGSDIPAITLTDICHS